MTLNGIRKFYGKVTRTFKITPYDISKNTEGTFGIRLAESAYPYSKDPMQRRVLSLEPLSFAAFFDEPVKDSFWWAAPECPVEERFVLSGMYY